MKISYESGELIKRLDEDIEILGDVLLYVYCKDYNGAKLYVDYDYDNEETKESENIIKMRAHYLLELLIEQDKII